jgi:hypothetical protein
MPSNVRATAWDRPAPTYETYRALLACRCCITLANGLEPRLGLRHAILCLYHGRRYRVVTWQRI